ncbi:unnamed protein product [Cercopithifilaria johnstoni]|uniref:Uncharacterized protein n=1 Tax=Cercopithifilaria johnstoni TaxID=2874296 RepID=A0A8J2LV83_9BILA|nr:unnamed protein product [Cercopithifilaria johnstoni]
MAQQLSITTTITVPITTTTTTTVPITTTTATTTTTVTTISNQSKYPFTQSELRLNSENSRSMNAIANSDLYHCQDTNNRIDNDNINNFYHNPIYYPNDYHNLSVKKYFSVDHFNRMVFETPQRRVTKKCRHCRKQNLLNQSFKHCKLISTKVQPASSQKLYSFHLSLENSNNVNANHSFECSSHRENMSLCICDTILKKNDSCSSISQLFTTENNLCSCFNNLNNVADNDNDSDSDDDAHKNNGNNDNDDDEEEEDEKNDSIISKDQHFNIIWCNENQNGINDGDNDNDDDNDRKWIASHSKESQIDQAKFIAIATEKLLTADRNMKEAQRFNISHQRMRRASSLCNIFFLRKLLSMEISNPILISSTKSTDYLRCLPKVQTLHNGLNDVRIFAQKKNFRINEMI